MKTKMERMLYNQYSLFQTIFLLHTVHVLTIHSIFPVIKFCVSKEYWPKVGASNVFDNEVWIWADPRNSPAWRRLWRWAQDAAVAACPCPVDTHRNQGAASRQQSVSTKECWTPVQQEGGDYGALSSRLNFGCEVHFESQVANGTSRFVYLCNESAVIRQGQMKVAAIE